MLTTNKPKMENKNFYNKSQASVISIVLIILISITAVVILSIYTTNFVKVKLSPPINCFDLKTSAPIRIILACYNQATNDVEVSLSRLSDIDLGGLKFILSTQGKNELYFCGSTCGTCSILDKGKTRKYFLSTNKKPETISLGLEDCFYAEKEIVSCRLLKK